MENEELFVDYYGELINHKAENDHLMSYKKSVRFYIQQMIEVLYNELKHSDEGIGFIRMLQKNNHCMNRQDIVNVLKELDLNRIATLIAGKEKLCG